MANVVIECILSRSTEKYYDPVASLSDDQVGEFVRMGASAPTSFYMQNWRFIAVRSPEAKVRLLPISRHPSAVTEAPVTFIIIGQLTDSRVMLERLEPLMAAGMMHVAMVPDWESSARDPYLDCPHRPRGEAMRTGTSGAATMIYAARSSGLGSTPTIGLDVEGGAREFELVEHEVPVMLLAVGSERDGNWAQKPHLPAADVLQFA